MSQLFKKTAESFHTLRTTLSAIDPETMRDEMHTFITTTIGSLINCAAIVLFVQPAKLPSAGVTGIGLMMNYLWNVPLGLSTAVMNAMLFVYAYKALPRRFFYWSLYSSMLISLAMEPLSHLPVPNISDRMLLVIVAAVINGASAAIVFSGGASTGGLDIVTTAIRRKTGSEVGSIGMAFNFAIIFMFGFLVPAESVVYGLLMSYIASMVMNGDLRSFSSRREAMIITDQPDIVREYLMFKLHRGVTVFEAKGGFDARPKHVLISLLNTSQAMHLKLFLKKNDPAAFMRLAVASEVLGKGFQHWERE